MNLIDALQEQAKRLDENLRKLNDRIVLLKKKKIDPVFLTQEVVNTTAEIGRLNDALSKLLASSETHPTQTKKS